MQIRKFPVYSYWLGLMIGKPFPTVGTWVLVLFSFSIFFLCRSPPAVSWSNPSTPLDSHPAATKAASERESPEERWDLVLLHSHHLESFPSAKMFRLPDLSFKFQIYCLPWHHINKLVLCVCINTAIDAHWCWVQSSCCPVRDATRANSVALIAHDLEVWQEVMPRLCPPAVTLQQSSP